MWLILLLAFLASSPEPQVGSLPPGGTIADDMAFGPQLVLTCTWFSNFENSRFEQCRGRAGNALPSSDGASLKCLAHTCEQLDAEARRVAHWRKAEPPWGTFTVRLVGRVSVHQHGKQYLGDGTSAVLIEKLLSVRPNIITR